MTNSGGTNWTGVAAVAAAVAALVAVVGVGVSSYYSSQTLRLTKEHNRKSVTPVVKVFAGRYGSELYVKNVGIRPALNLAMSYKYEGHPVNGDSLEAWARRESRVDGGSGRVVRNVGPEELTLIFDDDIPSLGVGDEEYILFMENGYTAEFEKLMTKMAVTVHFESIYGDPGSTAGP
jgi:hypothetical protein